ncbi:serine protease gd-like [Uranotaenia lowii]|uniref:serine protease gd-like n=1 Tax=Uranotaenia lowii TaxID=190385 RepID=UPI002478F9C6|nr:serine protease gd-like [Uranotaenia lowii]
MKMRFQGSRDETETEMIYHWPWYGLLHTNYGMGRYSICEITIVSKKSVVTSSGCVSDTPGNMIVKVGQKQDRLGYMEYGQVLNVSKVIKRDDFFAILHLSSELVFADYVQPICLWEGDTSQEHIDGQIGYMPSDYITLGSHHFGEDVEKKARDAVTFEITSSAVCEKSHPDTESFSGDKLFCARMLSEKIILVHQGSGLYIHHNNRWVLRGMSLSRLTPDKNSVAIFVDVRKYLTSDTEL